MRNTFLLAGVLLLCISLVSATPQVIRTTVNINVVNDTLRITGEGIDYTNTLTHNVENGTCRSSFSANNVELLFVRDFGNTTDLGLLIEKMGVCGDSLNYTKKWEDCIALNREISLKIYECDANTAYRQNYTDCMANLTIIENQAEMRVQQAATGSQAELSNYKTDAEKYKNQRYYWAIGAAVISLGIFGYRAGWFNKARAATEVYSGNLPKSYGA